MVAHEVDVDAMLKRLPSRLFTEWMAWDQLNPIGPERADLRAGNITAAILNTSRGKGQRAVSPTEFLLCDQAKKPQQTQKQMKGIFKRFCDAVRKRGERVKNK